MENKKSRWLISIIVAIVVIVGAGYYFIMQTTQKATHELTNSLQKAGFLYTKVDCQGLFSMQCVVNNAFLRDGTRVKKIVFNNFEQFAKIKKGKTSNIDLNISLLGIDANGVDLKNRIMLFSIMSGRILKKSDYEKIDKIIRLFVQGDMVIKGNLEFQGRKLEKFKNFGFSYNNAIFPFKLFLTGSNSNSVKEDPRNILFTNIKFDLNLKNKKETFGKILKIVSPDQNITDAKIDEKWNKFLQVALANIEKKKALSKNKLDLHLFDSVENILNGKKDKISFLLSSKDSTGISAMDIIKKGREDKRFIQEHVDVKIEN
ncbi:MAG: hypothetical protein R3331_09100 [Sulfurospirillaceae bacterium]|nr:hypothetical protein [Sulfurospirillaceae bacterium]